ncbi:MAG TPA: ferritin-like domain-containing protein [Thermoanaerobaculia bacterium]|nr:ferritin-like domain-containing protein [Thermoanaerobaculia bacterium]
MDSKEFVAGLMAEMESLFAQLGEHETLEAESGGRIEMVTLLKLALASELEASELAGSWMPSTTEIDAKQVFAAQCGDEMRHYALIEQRLAQLGEDLSSFDPLAEGHSPLYEYMRGLRTMAERMAAGPFASEAIAQVRNRQFIAWCESVGDAETARLYRDVIQPEELHHHLLGRAILEKYAITPEVQELVANAVRTTLAIADELATLSEKTTGLQALPVS